MVLHIDRQEGPDRPEGTITCDLEIAENCETTAELGVHLGWSDAQFRELVTGEKYRWRFETRNGRYACPPCAALEDHRIRPPALAGEGFAAPFGTVPKRPGRRETPAAPGTPPAAE